MTPKLKTFWLNIDFIDRDLCVSQRLAILSALNRAGLDVSTSFNYVNHFPTVNGLRKVSMLKLRAKGLFGAILLSLEQQLTLLNNLNADIVVVRAFNLQQTIPLWFLIRKILRLKKPKFVLDIRSYVADEQGKWQRKQRQMRFDGAVKFAFSYFDGITMITEEMKKELQAKFQGSERDICVWTSGVDPKFFNPDGVQDLRDRLDFQNRFVIMYHGILTPNRGLQQAIEAVSLLRETHPEIMLLLLGKGPSEQELKNLVAAKKLENNVVIHPAVPFKEVPKFIQSAHVGILPFPDFDTWNTSSPIKLNEYLAMQKPVIVTDIPAHRNVLNNLGCAFFVSDEKPESLAAGMKAAVEKRNELAELGEIGRLHALKNFTWDSQAAKIKSYFEKLVA